MLFSLLALLLCGTLLISLAFGGTRVPVTDVLSALFHPSGDIGSVIVWKIRFPRVILGLLVGMGLSASGCVFQGMLRNPLADPYTLGISGGAALGATLGIVFGLTSFGIIFLPLCAFAGTLACLYTVYLTAVRNHFSTNTLILTGVILGFIFSSLVLLLFALSSADKVHAAITWLMGDLSSAEANLIRIVAGFVLTGTALLLAFGRELNVMTLGEEKASHLGLDTVAAQRRLFLIASFITGACVSAAGMIGFVGLIVPHFMRRFTGPDHELLIPASALGGAIFLPLCDTLARTILAPVELPVGVITGFIGGIFFLLFLIRSGEHKVF